MIGVFDSGFGGLTVLKEFLRVLPDYDYIYLGDNARAPYGNKSDEVIYNYTREAVDFLFKQGCELVIIACHTASSKALRKIQREYLPAKYPNKRVLGVVVPLVEEGWTGRPETKMILKKYLRPLKLKKIDTLILGCTHYPLLLKDISGIMGKNVKIVNPAETVAEKLVDYLRRHGEIEKRLGKNKKLIFYTTDDVSKFRELGRKFLGKEIKEIKKAVL